MAAKIGLASGDRQPWKSAVELEAQRDDGARDDRAAVFAGRLVAPVGEEVPARGVEKGRVGAADRVDGNDAALLVDRDPDRDRALFLIGAASSQDRAASFPTEELAVADRCAPAGQPYFGCAR